MDVESERRRSKAETIHSKLNFMGELNVHKSFLPSTLPADPARDSRHAWLKMACMEIPVTKTFYFTIKKFSLHSFLVEISPPTSTTASKLMRRYQHRLQESLHSGLTVLFCIFTIVVNFSLRILKNISIRFVSPTDMAFYGRR